jgi:hypothetical protein
MPQHSVVSNPLGAASLSPRPAAAAALAAFAAAAATLIGTDRGADLASSAAQSAAVIAITALSLGAVLVAAKGRAYLIVLQMALLSAGAAAIHFAAAGSHFREWWGFGVFFVASGVAQLAWALLAVKSPSRAVWWVGVLGNAAIVALWILTRTVGTLVGPDAHTPEPVGVPDAVASGFELAIVLAVLLGANARRSNRKLDWSVGGITFALTSLALSSVMGIATGAIPPMQ